MFRDTCNSSTELKLLPLLALLIPDTELVRICVHDDTILVSFADLPIMREISALVVSVLRVVRHVAVVAKLPPKFL